MNINDVLDLLNEVEIANLSVWIGGGWGVDALVGYQTRVHNDIDIYMQKKDSSAFIKLLNKKGFNEKHMEYTTANHTVWCDENWNTVDLHLFEFVDDKTLSFENEFYPSDIFNGEGKISDMTVRCLTVEAQLLYHQGYEHSENDVHDVLLLCKTFELPIPDQYVLDSSQE